MKSFLAEAKAWAQGRQWPPRLALLFFCAFVFYRHLQDPLYGGIIKGLNLALHEIGHVMFAFAGDLMGIAGGTVFQLAAPLITAWLFYRQRDFFGIAIALCWLGTSFFDVAVYAGDARAGDLPLVGLGGGEPEHDWFIMLAEAGLLNADQTIAAGFRACGMFSFAAGLLLGGWLIHQMRLHRAAATANG
jgi:hypothetical protein